MGKNLWKQPSAQRIFLDKTHKTES